MSQNSEQIESKLCAYIDGELDEKDRADIEKHLAAHPHHRHLLKELAETRRLLRLLPRESAPPELAESFQGQLERSVLLNDTNVETAYDSPMRINRLPQYLAAAAVVVLAAGLGVVVYLALPQPHVAKVVIETPASAPSLTPDQRSLVDTLAKRDSKDADRSADIDVAGATPDSGSGDPDTAARAPTKENTDKATDAIAEVGKGDGLGGGSGTAATPRRSADEKSAAAAANDFSRNHALDKAAARTPLVIVVSATDPQRAREEAAQYLQGLGVTSTALGRASALDEAPKTQSIEKSPADPVARKDVGDRNVATLYEQARRVLAHDSSRQEQSEKAKQVTLPDPELEDQHVAAVPPPPAPDAATPAEPAKAPAAPSPAHVQAQARAAKSDGASGRSRGGAAAPRTAVPPDAGASKGAAPSVAESVAANVPQKKIGPGVPAKPQAAPAERIAAQPVAPATASTSPAKSGKLSDAVPHEEEDLNLEEKPEQIIVAQNVTREQFKSIQESFQSSDDAQGVRVLNGAPSFADAENQSRQLQSKAEFGQAADAKTLKNREVDKATEASRLAAKPGAEATDDPPAPKAAVEAQAVAPPAAPAPHKFAATRAEDAQQDAQKRAAALTVKPGERLHISVERADNETDKIEEEVIVGKDGSFQLPDSKTVQGSGASLAQLEAKIADAYRFSEDPATNGATAPRVHVKRLAATTAPTKELRAAGTGGRGPTTANATPGLEAPKAIAGAGHLEAATARQSAQQAPAKPPTTTPHDIPQSVENLDVVIVFRRASTKTTVPASESAVEEPTAEPKAQSAEPSAQKKALDAPSEEAAEPAAPAAPKGAEPVEPAEPQ